jgi:hypothetical protein
MSEEGTFHKGDSVGKEGDYICVPCGYKKHFEPGDTFTECTSCLAGTSEGHEDYMDGTEMWEKIKPSAE